MLLRSFRFSRKLTRRTIISMSSSPNAKRVKRTDGVSIGTHSGTFHCDEVVGCFLLTNYVNEYIGADVTRTRDSKVLETLPIIIDVGGTYSFESRRFDHHQREFNETFSEEYKTKLSSAGLVYKHFGKEIIGNICKETDDAVLELVYQRIYKNFVHALDCVDNGVDRYPRDVQPYYVETTTLASRIGRLNSKDRGNDALQMTQFKVAMEVAGSEFVQAVEITYNDWLPGRRVVETALQKRFEVHPSGELVRFPEPVGWKSHIYQLESDLEIATPIKYVLYESGPGDFRVQCVSASSTSFENRLSLPEPWRGVRDEALNTLSGVPQCTFVHASGFIGGNKTAEGALAMAIKALEFTSSE